MSIICGWILGGFSYQGNLLISRPIYSDINSFPFLVEIFNHSDTMNNRNIPMIFDRISALSIHIFAIRIFGLVLWVKLFVIKVMMRLIEIVIIFSA